MTINTASLLTPNRIGDTPKVLRGTQRDFNITLPTPHALQWQIMNHPAPFHIVCAGRRAGKTTFAAMEAALGFLNYKDVLISSTSQDQADVFWGTLKKWFHTLIDAKLIHKDETKRTLEIYDVHQNRYGLIRCKTGRDPDRLRGGRADLAILDECAFLHPTVWTDVILPMFGDARNPRAYLISTPIRKNWFYKLYMEAPQKPEQWQRWHFTSLQNPYLEKAALLLSMSNLPMAAIQQEIFATFLDGQGQVFNNLVEAFTIKPEPSLGKIGHRATVTPYEGRFVVGVDWAQTNDFTVFSVFDMDKRQQVEMVRTQHNTYRYQRKLLGEVVERWNPVNIIVETNSMGQPNYEELLADGFPVTPFATTGSTKPPLIEAMVLGLEQRTVKLLDDEVQYDEFQSYERTIGKYGHPSYDAAAGFHDDTVMAACLAYHGMQQTRTLSFVV